MYTCFSQEIQKKPHIDYRVLDVQNIWQQKYSLCTTEATTIYSNNHKTNTRGICMIQHDHNNNNVCALRTYPGPKKYQGQKKHDDLIMI